MRIGHQLNSVDATTEQNLYYMRKTLTLIALLVSAVAYSQTCVVNSHSLQFNGNTSSGDLTTSTNLSITDSITVEAWINPAAFAAIPAQGTVFCAHSWTGVGGEQGYVLRAGGTGVVSWNIAGMDTNGTPVSWVEALSNANAVTLNNWTHIAGTYDGQNLKLYINGALIAATPFTGTIVPTGDYLPKVGRLSDGGMPASRYWNGKLDEIRIWHRSLSAAELTANKSKHIDAATANGLVGYWRFNDGPATTADDLSTSNNNLTLSSTTWATLVPFVDQPPVPIVQNFPQLLNCLSTGVTYQWNLAGSPISGATGQTYTPTATGSYSVTVAAASGCSATSAPTTWTLSTGINENELDKYFTVSPNPATDNLMLDVEAINIYNTYSVCDIEGRVILTGNVQSGKQPISISTLSPGTYLLMLKGEVRNDARRIQVIN